MKAGLWLFGEASNAAVKSEMGQLHNQEVMKLERGQLHNQEVMKLVKTKELTPAQSQKHSHT